MIRIILLFTFPLIFSAQLQASPAAGSPFESLIFQAENSAITSAASCGIRYISHEQFFYEFGGSAVRRADYYLVNRVGQVVGFYDVQNLNGGKYYRYTAVNGQFIFGAKARWDYLDVTTQRDGIRARALSALSASGYQQNYFCDSNIHVTQSQLNWCISEAYNSYVIEPLCAVGVRL